MAAQTHPHARQGGAPSLPGPAMVQASAHWQAADPDSPFWCGAIGSAAGTVLALAFDIDTLAQRAAQLPVRPALTRPVVGQYLCMVKTLAAAWHQHSRPALQAALGALAQFGLGMGQALTPEALGPCRVEHGRAGARVADALQRRLAAPQTALAALAADCAGYLAQVARVSAELEADTRLVTARLQADQVHVFLLSQQASALQARLDETALRQQARWLAEPQVQALRQEAALHGSALDGVRRHLDQLRAEQGATRAEADYLQSVLPGVAPYLGALERMAGALGAVVAGVRMLEARLAQLQAEAGAAAPGAGALALQLEAALPHWQALAAACARLGARSPA